MRCSRLLFEGLRRQVGVGDEQRRARTAGVACCCMWRVRATRSLMRFKIPRDCPCDAGRRGLPEPGLTHWCV